MNMEDIYQRYDGQTVEANKMLPKPYYGNASGYYCNYECKARKGCYSVTMQKWGVCDCKFRPSCHVSRQSIQQRMKEGNPSHICDFKNILMMQLIRQLKYLKVL